MQQLAKRCLIEILKKREISIHSQSPPKIHLKYGCIQLVEDWFLLQELFQKCDTDATLENLHIIGIHHSDQHVNNIHMNIRYVWIGI